MFYQGRLQQVFGKHALTPFIDLNYPEAIVPCCLDILLKPILAVGYTVVQPLIRQLGVAKTFFVVFLHAVELSQVVPLASRKTRKFCEFFST